MKKVRIVYILVVVLFIPLFYQCQKEDIEKKNSVEDYLSDNYIADVETLKDFYSVAIQNTREKGTLKSTGLTVYTLENQVAQMCSEKFGNEFDTEYMKIKDLTGIEPFKSKTIEDDGVLLSEYVINLLSEIDKDIENLFEDEYTPSNDEMLDAVTAELMFYQEQIVNDEILSVDEKTYLLNSIQSQILMLPTTLEVADLLFQTNVEDSSTIIKRATLKRGWFAKARKKVLSFVGTIMEYGGIALLCSGGNEYAGIAGYVVGLGVAIYCGIDGDHCACAPIECAANKYNESKRN